MVFKQSMVKYTRSHDRAHAKSVYIYIDNIFFQFSVVVDRTAMWDPRVQDGHPSVS